MNIIPLQFQTAAKDLKKYVSVIHKVISGFDQNDYTIPSDN